MAPRVDNEALRRRLAFALRLDRDDPGSLYLHALGACYLASPADHTEGALENLFYLRALQEDVDGDELVTALCMAGGTP